MIKPTKVRVRGETRWIVNIRKRDKRYRNFFQIVSDAVNFDEHDYVNEISKKKPAGYKTILSVARDHYLNEYAASITRPSQHRRVI